ncbi:hypothetical protein G7K71_08070 [Desulfofundulus sp. TPOSR]|uniref:hypothetical protein n=1 Tax=Desulfofundulus sp. TPOSR TaxID=2714340 RepID=UPI00140DEF94|nr:hypothetical protein [Desulfofundulus sp. TPOSR]NHM26938.1 hypothetical protein [Desulfofundulus sp. TPOSR]
MNYVRPLEAINRIRSLVTRLVGIPVFLGSWLAATEAWAAGGIAERTAEDVATKLVNIFKEILMPIGAFVIFIAVAWTAFLIITTANRPEKRAEAMGSLPYILGGGVLLGGSMLVAGFIVGLMAKAGQ